MMYYSTSDVQPVLMALERKGSYWETIDLPFIGVPATIPGKVSEKLTGSGITVWHWTLPPAGFTCSMGISSACLYTSGIDVQKRLETPVLLTQSYYMVCWECAKAALATTDDQMPSVDLLLSWALQYEAVLPCTIPQLSKSHWVQLVESKKCVSCVPSHTINAGEWAVYRPAYGRYLCMDFMKKRFPGEPLPAGAKSSDGSYAVEEVIPTSAVCHGCRVPVCNVHSKCESPDCPFVGLYVVDAGTASTMRHLLAKTQKIKGYVALTKVLPSIQPYAVVTSEEDLTGPLTTVAGMGENIFVRPCPITPRHGFVDSRSVSSGGGLEKLRKQLRSIFDEARAADPKAEILILPYMKAELNYVITPSRMSIGKGHDGATAGRDVITIPLVGKPFPECNAELYKKAKVDLKTSDPYFEAVSIATDPRFTQLRAGPKIPSAVGADYVPYPVVVKEVVEARGDLLEWEALTHRLQQGTVVDHVGGDLTSHYGAHCLANKIPIMTSRHPRIGERLEVQSKGEDPNPEAVVNGLLAGALIDIRVGYHNGPSSTYLATSPAVAAMLLPLHNYGAMTGEHGFWIGLSASLMFRLGAAASQGEARHRMDARWARTGRPTRETVFAKAFTDFRACHQTLGGALYRFKHSSWTSGYGGAKWADCTESIISLETRIRQLMNNPCQRMVAAMVTDLNVAVNKAHNGGWWMNKFTGADTFNLAARQSLRFVVGAGNALYVANELGKKIPKSQFDELLAWWKAQETITEKDGPIMAELDEALKKKSLVTPIPPSLKSGGWVYSDMWKKEYAKVVLGVPLSSSPPSQSLPSQPANQSPPVKVKTSKSYNVQGEVPLTTACEVTLAQIRATGKGYHCQFKTKASGENYYSISFLSATALSLEKDPQTFKSWHYESDANGYRRFEPSKAPGVGTWILKNEKTSSSVVLRLESMTIEPLTA